MSGRQLSIFDPQPNFEIVARLKSAMAQAIERTGQSREQILDRMHEIADRAGVKLKGNSGHRLTLATFEKWLAPSETGRLIPLQALPIFMEAVGDVSPLAVLADPVGAKVVSAEEAKLLDWAKTSLTIRKASRQKKKIEQELGID